MSILAATAKALLPPAEKAVTGAGAFSMERGHYIGDVGRDTPRTIHGQRLFIKEALGIYHTDRHIKRAEQVVSQRVAGLKWHLEEPDGTEVTDDSPDNLIVIRDLLESPTGGERIGNQPRTRRELWGLTIRHAGLVNVGFWYLDEIDRAAGWPERILYIRPDRMSPGLDDNGELKYWALDASDNRPGTRLELNEVLVFYLEPPDDGFYGRGQVEAAMDIARKTRLGDRHELDVLSSGGRLAGIISPKMSGAGGPMDPTAFDRLQNDLRNVVEMPDAAKRAIVARAPVDFIPTAADLERLQTVELGRLNREEKFGLWGVDPQLAGYPGPGGLNSGESRAYIEASTWQNACQPRVDMLWEAIQYQLLDRLDKLGVNLSLEIETPTFDDDMPKFDMAQKAENLPLTQKERRALVGLPPFDDERDDEVWLGNVRIYGIEQPAAAAVAGAEATTELTDEELAGLLDDEQYAGVPPLEYEEEDA
jgi:hypothetical protein